MVVELNDLSKKNCGKGDERCEAILDAELRRVMAGIERAVADDVTHFSRFITILNDLKTDAGKLFADMNFDSDFFISCRNIFSSIIASGQIAGVEVGTGDHKDEFRINVLGTPGSRAHWESKNTFIMNIIGSEKFLTERNLIDHLSSSHTATKEAMAVFESIRSTNVSAAIMKLIRDNKIIPEILQSAMVFRALGDNGSLIKDGRSGTYHIPVQSKLGKILAGMVTANSFLTKSEDGQTITVPFGNVVNLVSVLFKAVRTDKDKPLRTPVSQAVADSYLANAVAFRFESAVISKLRAAKKSG
jgi:hypothetical protein